MKKIFGDLNSQADSQAKHESAQWLNFFVTKLVIEPAREWLLAEEPEVLKLRLSTIINDWVFNQRHMVAATRFISAVTIKSININPSSRPDLSNFHVVSPEVAGNGSAALRFCLQWTQIGSVELDSALQYVTSGSSAAPFVALPLSMSLNLKVIRATVQAQFSVDDRTVQLACLPDDILSVELEVGSLIGHRSKLKDLPRVTMAVKDVIKKVLLERVIHPRTLSIPINYKFTA